ncbi:MAG TPA: hypothetical protein PLV45_12730, partial [bacterium]|nr:hypothetical protein [bacterium]
MKQSETSGEDSIMATRRNNITVSRKPTLVFWRTFIVFFFLIEAAFIFLILRSYTVHQYSGSMAARAGIRRGEYY